jgi:hypothetical protein
VRGILDTSVFIAEEQGRVLAADRLPDEAAISVVTLAELGLGVHMAAGEDVRARRLRTLQTLLLAGLEISGAAAALASEVGHGGLEYNSAYRVAETMAEARAEAGDAGEDAYARGRGVPPLERVPRMLWVARALET